MENIRIATVIAHAPIGREQDNLDRMALWVEKAVRKGVRILCFPELNISGYGTRGHHIQAARRLGDPEAETLKSMAKRAGITILAGMLEKDALGCVYASHLVARPDGFLGVYRKLHLAPPERSIFQPASDIPLFQSEGLTFGIQLCYDAHFPELSTCMAEKGADAIFIPHASPRGTPAEKYRSWLRHLTARAYDNSIFIIACNQTGDNGDGLTFPGLAVTIGPSGNPVKKRFSIAEAMMISDLNASELADIRGHRMRYFLPNRRPELYGSALDHSTSAPLEKVTAKKG